MESLLVFQAAQNPPDSRKKQGMNVLVTGINGYIGSNVCERLWKKGQAIIGLDRRESRLSCFRHDTRFRFHCADIAEIASLPESLRSTDVIIHCAALVHQRSKRFSRKEYFRVNAEGTRNILSRLDPGRLQQIIFLSTVSVYGAAAAGRVPDENTPLAPEDYYGESKAAAEDAVQEFSRLHSIPHTIFRLTPVYGRTFLVNLSKRVCLPKKLGFYKIASGRQRLSLCSIHNLVDAVADGLNNVHYFHETTILKDPADYSVDEIIDGLKEFLSREGRPVLRIPRGIPAAAFECLGLVMPARAKTYTYRWKKIAQDAVYSGAQMALIEIPLKWDLRTTLQTPEECPRRTEVK
jgi:nucleoside-diphosphate-sugar epimerase